MTLSDLLVCLDLTAEGEADAQVSRWTGRPQEHPDTRTFGGLLLGQAVVAAGRTVPSGHRLLSLQADFVAAVPVAGMLHWETTRVCDGSLSTRRTRLLGAAGEELFVATSRWGGVRSDLPSISATRPAEVPGPDGLLDLDERWADETRVPMWWRMSRPVHLRHVEPPPYVEAVPVRDRQSAHLRAKGALPDDHLVRAAVLAYVSDMCLLEPAFTALGAVRHDPGSRLLSLTHVVTFHADGDLTQWHQLDARVASIAHGRAHGHGELFGPGGHHVASVSQVAFVGAARA